MTLSILGVCLCFLTALRFRPPSDICMETGLHWAGPLCCSTQQRKSLHFQAQNPAFLAIFLCSADNNDDIGKGKVKQTSLWHLKLQQIYALFNLITSLLIFLFNMYFFRKKKYSNWFGSEGFLLFLTVFSGHLKCQTAPKLTSEKSRFQQMSLVTENSRL